MNQFSPEDLRKVYDENNGDLHAIAGALGISPSELATNATPALTTPARRRQPPADIGKPYFLKYRVSVRHADWSMWPSDDQSKIEQARAKYEAGTHTMCQGRDGDWFVLYCVPLQQRVGARKFFRTEF